MKRCCGSIIPNAYSTRGEADSDAIRQQGTADFVMHAAVIGRNLHPYVLGAEYSIADPYLYMLASWHPDKAALHAQLPAIGAHAALMQARPAVAKIEAEHANQAAS